MANRTKRAVFRDAAAWRLIAAIAALAGTGQAALAHTGTVANADHLLSEWTFDPLIWGLSAFFAWLFLRGALLRSAAGRPVHMGRQVAYSAGLGLILLALVSPIDFMAEHLFWMHQVQHMALRLTGPMLILAAAPQGVIFAGMPRGVRRLTLGPVLRRRWLRWLGHWLSRPAVATLLFIGALYIWEVPALHDAALLNEPLHYFMHVSMMAAGVLFFWVVFDRRDPPKGVRHGARMAMLGAALLFEIIIGAFTTMKSVELYPAYDVVGRLFGTLPMTDETAGGFLMWPPSSMMFVLAMLLAVYRWNGTEDRQWQRLSGTGRSNSAALLVPETAEELWMIVTPKNRRMGLGLGLLALTMAFLAVGVVDTVEMFY